MSQARVAELVERATSPDLKAADMEAIKQIITMVNDSEQKWVSRFILHLITVSISYEVLA